MANAQHLEILKSGVDTWNKWRKNQENDYLDLSGADLREADLSKVNLRGAGLYNAKLSGANLTEAKLVGASLDRADLSNTNLVRANLIQANLIGTNLKEADLTEAELFKADLSHAELCHAELCLANFLRANLNGANLNSAFLNWTDLSEATLIGADLSKANLCKANLTHANLNGAVLNDTVFLETRLGNTVFGLTDLSSSNNLESIEVSSPCVIDFYTLRVSKNLPKEFLIKLGIPDLLTEHLPNFYNPALKIYPAFLSHSWSDKAFVRLLYEALTGKGVTVWLDEKKLKPGDNIHDSISEGIKYYDKLILVCSENSLKSWWVEKELEKVYEKEREMQKERGKKFRLVIPIRIDDHILNWKEGILTTVRNSVIGDFTKWQDEVAFEEAVKELVGALNANRVDVRPPSFL